MTCRDFQTRLTSAIESRDYVEVARLAEHVAQCADDACQACWSDHQLLTRAVAQWKIGQHLAVPRMSDRVLDQVAAESLAVRRLRSGSAGFTSRSRGIKWSSVAVAAALLLTIGLLLRPAGESQFLAVRVKPPITPLQTTPAPLVAQHTPRQSGPEEVRPESYVELAHEATYFVTDLAMLVVPVDVDAADESATPGWINRLGERLEPVRTGVEGKLGEWFSPPAT